MKRATALYRALLYAYPAAFRHEYGDEMGLIFVEQLREARRAGAWRNEAVLWLQVVRDLVIVAPVEHWHVLDQDLRYAFRTMAARPSFSAVAILTLALGIGATTAIFSVWNGVLRAPLPGVDDPGGLVMLTDPGAAGLLRGRASGTRSWLSYGEFEQLRDHATGFAGLMASDSTINTWRVRVDGGEPEEMHGRLVSGGFFQVLGVRPAIGRLLTTLDDRGDSQYAVISYAHWQRRFGGRSDVIGKTLTIRETPVSIVGVAAPGFAGETSGERPDLWLPLRLQPRVLPGSDRLHEKPPDKVMWLHVFGRLRDGTTAAQAEAEANAVFQASLEPFYGPGRPEERLDQRIQLQPGGRGASSARGEFSSSLTVLLASSAVLLLIACANLASLFATRGAARRTEIALRVSLGASRRRIIRQLFTEGVALAAIGGGVAIVFASILHAALVRLLQQAEPQFFVDFALTASVVGFVIGATLVSAVLVAVLPAWQATKADPGRGLADSSRGTIGSARELRAGRWLAGAQLALSLPLLVGAGLLVRTAVNLQHPQLGFDTERLLVARVHLRELALDPVRRDRVLRELQARMQQIPGVAAVTFSQLGLFEGGVSTASIEVTDGTATSEVRDSALDRVGTGYFTTLGIPLLWGRDIAENDRADTHKVCIVNEAFVREYLGGRDARGMRVTTHDDGVRATYEIVGLAADARTQHVQGEVEPRFFVPAEQRPSQGLARMFLIRTVSAAPPVAAAVRDAAGAVDSALTASDLDLATIEQHMAPLSADQRSTAQLAVVFGLVALTLAAIGLYGVLSFGITRRSSEIAIRMALGADTRRILALVLRDTTAVVVAGLLAGAGLAYVASRLIASRLYGVAAQDPLTFAAATAMLVAVAAIATYLPARRATRLEPMIALRQT